MSLGNSVSEYEQHSQSLIVQHCVDFCDRLHLHHCVRVRLSLSKLYFQRFGHALEEHISDTIGEPISQRYSYILEMHLVYSLLKRVSICK